MEAVVVKTDKRLDASKAPKLDAELEALADAGQRNVVLDMQETNYISSMALRVILKMVKRMNADGGRFVLRGVTETVREVFDVTNFTSILSFEEDE